MVEGWKRKEEKKRKKKKKKKRRSGRRGFERYFMSFTTEGRSSLIGRG